MAASMAARATVGLCGRPPLGRRHRPERADLYAFTLWQMGVPGYELK